ncbi:hypothetical protein EST38_g2655 [Candolleomyces aberdarensis]|uniref:ER membrane protein complex subunit 2 n=1 Tax=Candolleomyces aberdarensis TaxID=2316362 RepID=A0A4Q2DW89_9AGAR|nr:hypothetical protein EST38_g2655 [Candolleomyces aberdarensis]
MSVSSALQRLANYRFNNSRASLDVFKHGQSLLKSGVTPKNDESWEFLEQLALAAIDLDKLDVADVCLQKLGAKFPGSPRVEVLTGIRMEASEPITTVLEYYNDLLIADPTNAAAWKRRISVLRRARSLDKATEELIQYLDTFYTDPEGWLELADIYVSNLLNPQNPFTFVQFAETAYSSGDLPLALKMFLVAIEMMERDLESPETTPPTGLAFRAWWGIKLCARHLLGGASGVTSSPSNTPVPKHLKSVDALATERVLGAYKGKELEERRRLVERWLSSSK